jgi:hypothetical protein
MKKLILLTCILLMTGCTVMRTVDYEIKREVAGFKDDWNRTFGNEKSN